MSSTDILLITPPFTQLNTPYPATAFLKGTLQNRGISVEQMDLGIETLLALFSKQGLTEMFDLAETNADSLSEGGVEMMAKRKNYEAWIDPMISFLQGKDHALAHSIIVGDVPKGKRFATEIDEDWLFGSNGLQDKAKFFATLFLEDVGDFITENIDSSFGFSRYAEQLCSNSTGYDPILNQLEENTIVTEYMIDLLEKKMKAVQPRIVGFSVPFPGNLLSALKAANYIRKQYPDTVIAMGGGYPNTELRSLSDPRIFDLVDYILLDDGEQPLEQLVKYTKGEIDRTELNRTYYRENGEVVYWVNDAVADLQHKELAAPDYAGLPLNDYVSVLETVNPMHRLWSDGRWNKMMIAHGCYWSKCSFCDTTLDYIKRFSQTSASALVDQMETVIAQTGQRGFHFIDEAAPPYVLRELALELLRRNLVISWWANVRFEKTFNADLCQLLAKSGCIAVSGGLEVASDRLLKLIDKGVDIEQVARVTRDLSDAGIMVHAYLMYGFPTQTVQETVDSLEVVRQLFENRLVQSGFWHRFAMTVHSPIGQNPEAFGVTRVDIGDGTFAENDLAHEDPKGCEHGLFSFGLKKSLYNFMHELGTDFPLQDWFDFRIPRTKIPKNRIADALEISTRTIPQDKHRLMWLYGTGEVVGTKKGKVKLAFATGDGECVIQLPKEEAEFLQELLSSAKAGAETYPTVGEVKEQFEDRFGLPGDHFFMQRYFLQLRNSGLLLV